MNIKYGKNDSTRMKQKISIKEKKNAIHIKLKKNLNSYY